MVKLAGPLFSHQSCKHTHSLSLSLSLSNFKVQTLSLTSPSEISLPSRYFHRQRILLGNPFLPGWLEWRAKALMWERFLNWSFWIRVGKRGIRFKPIDPSGHLHKPTHRSNFFFFSKSLSSPTHLQASHFAQPYHCRCNHDPHSKPPLSQGPHIIAQHHRTTPLE